MKKRRKLKGGTTATETDAFVLIFLLLHFSVNRWICALPSSAHFSFAFQQ